MARSALIGSKQVVSQCHILAWLPIRLAAASNVAPIWLCRHEIICRLLNRLWPMHRLLFHFFVCELRDCSWQVVCSFHKSWAQPLHDELLAFLSTNCAPWRIPNRLVHCFLRIWLTHVEYLQEAKYCQSHQGQAWVLATSNWRYWAYCHIALPNLNLGNQPFLVGVAFWILHLLFLCIRY